MEIEYTEIKNEIAIEESQCIKLTIGQVKFFWEYRKSCVMAFSSCEI